MKTLPILLASILLLAAGGVVCADPDKRNTVIHKRDAQQQGVKSSEPAKKEPKEAAQEPRNSKKPEKG